MSSSAVTFPSASPTSIDPNQSLATPLLPAFLITGLFICCAISLLTWRYVNWQTGTRPLTAQERAVFLAERRVRNGGDAYTPPQPRIWDVWASSASSRSSSLDEKEIQYNWSDIQPLSVANLPPAQSSTSPLEKTIGAPGSTLQIACLVTMPTSCSSPTEHDDRYQYAIGVTTITPEWRDPNTSKP